jgi:hypothetical protein
MEGKTYLYKRVMIVENGVKSPKDDDAHYITFTFKGCHESDKDGFDAKHGFVDYTKDENNLHCYYGSCFYGKAHYYFSNDYMRLNVQINENLVYVYQREPSGRTTAKLRGAYPETNGGGGRRKDLRVKHTGIILLTGTIAMKRIGMDIRRIISCFNTKVPRIIFLSMRIRRTWLLSSGGNLRVSTLLLIFPVLII